MVHDLNGFFLILFFGCEHSILFFNCKSMAIATPLSIQPAKRKYIAKAIYIYIIWVYVRTLLF